MGFNHCYLSNVENLQKEYESVGLENFVKRYRKYDAITGPTECFNFLDEKRKEYETVTNTNINNDTNRM
jgi:hypothetical protein